MLALLVKVLVIAGLIWLVVYAARDQIQEEDRKERMEKKLDEVLRRTNDTSTGEDRAGSESGK